MEQTKIAPFFILLIEKLFQNYTVVTVFAI